MGSFLISVTCNLCRNADETLQHLVLCCEALQDIREPLIKRIIDVGSEVLANRFQHFSNGIQRLLMGSFILIDINKRTYNKF
jgi:hypothetical protein